jgi:hypothetical protein
LYAPAWAASGMPLGGHPFSASLVSLPSWSLAILSMLPSVMCRSSTASCAALRINGSRYLLNLAVMKRIALSSIRNLPHWGQVITDSACISVLVNSARAPHNRGQSSWDDPFFEGICNIVLAPLLWACRRCARIRQRKKMQVDGGSLAAPLYPTPPSILQSVDVPIFGWTEGRTILRDISDVTAWSHHLFGGPAHLAPPWPDTCKGGRVKL